MVHYTTLKQWLVENAPGRHRGSFLLVSSWVIQTTTAFKTATNTNKTNYCVIPNRIMSIPAGLLVLLKAIPQGQEKWGCLTEQCTVPRRSTKEWQRVPNLSHIICLPTLTAIPVTYCFKTFISPTSQHSITLSNLHFIQLKGVSTIRLPSLLGDKSKLP